MAGLERVEGGSKRYRATAEWNSSEHVTFEVIIRFRGLKRMKLSDMDDIYIRIQVYLMRKDKECGSLRFLTSETTAENAKNVSDVCESIKSILLESNSVNQSECEAAKIESLKFLLLNVNFQVQEHLCEDIANGHLVDMCPPLSPYLFVRLAWNLNYEAILCNFILYMPVDLCAEVLDAARRCLHLLDLDRAMDVGLKFISNSHQKLLVMRTETAQALDGERSMEKFIASVQELVLSLRNFYEKQCKSLAVDASYEKWGRILMKLIRTVHFCLENGKDIPSIDKSLEKLYKITFSRDYNVKFDGPTLEKLTKIFDKELVNIILKHIPPIDVNMYLAWADIEDNVDDDKSDMSISLQRTIGLACYNFVTFLKETNDPEAYDHVILSLQNLCCQPSLPASMSIVELLNEANSGNVDCLRELINRFPEWGEGMLQCLEKNCSYLEKSDCLRLLNNASALFSRNLQEALRRKVFITAIRILLYQKLADIFEIVARFLMAHNGTGNLESSNFTSEFNNFIENNVTLCSDSTSLRIVLFFLVQNPRKVLRTFIEIIVRYPEYEGSLMLPENFCKLSIFMQIRDTNGSTMLVNALRTVCSSDTLQNSKNFTALVNCLLQKEIMSADVLVNEIFIPVIENCVNPTNLQSFVACIRMTRNKLTTNANKHSLIIVLARCLSRMRKSMDIPIHELKSAIDALLGIIRYFVNERSNPLTDQQRSWLSDEAELLEPIDRIYLDPLCSLSHDVFRLDKIINDYEKRYHYILYGLASETNVNNQESVFRGIPLSIFEESHLSSLEFLSHLLIRATDCEYQQFAKEAVIVYWNLFGWADEYEAYSAFAFLNISIYNDCLRSTLMKSSSQMCAFVLKRLAKFSMWLANIDQTIDYEALHNGLLKAMSSLDFDQVNSDLPCSSDEFKFTISKLSSNDPYEKFIELVRHVDEFADEAARYINHPAAIGDSLTKFNVYFQLVDICINFLIDKNSRLSTKLDNKLRVTD